MLNRSDRVPRSVQTGPASPQFGVTLDESYLNIGVPRATVQNPRLAGAQRSLMLRLGQHQKITDEWRIVPLGVLVDPVVLGQVVPAAHPPSPVSISRSGTIWSGRKITRYV